MEAVIRMASPSGGTAWPVLLFQGQPGLFFCMSKFQVWYVDVSQAVDSDCEWDVMWEWIYDIWHMCFLYITSDLWHSCCKSRFLIERWLTGDYHWLSWLCLFVCLSNLWFDSSRVCLLCLTRQSLEPWTLMAWDLDLWASLLSHLMLLKGLWLCWACLLMKRPW